MARLPRRLLAPRPLLALACLGLGAWAALDDSGEDPLLLTAGEHRFRWVAGWPRLEGADFVGPTHGGIAFDRAGQLYVNTNTERAVLRLSAEGAVERSFGEALGPGTHGLVIVAGGSGAEAAEESVYLAHAKGGLVVRATLEGEVLASFGVPDPALYPEGSTYRPTDVAVLPDGRFFAADGYGLSFVHRYDSAGEYLGSFGGLGEEPGKLRVPHGLLVDPRTEPPTLLVADRGNGRLQRFTLEGEWLEVLAEDSLRRPCSMALRGEVLAVADLTGRLTLLDADFELIGHLGENPDESLVASDRIEPENWRDGLFLAPHDLAWDAAGNLYVSGWSRWGRVSKLERVR